MDTGCSGKDRKQWLYQLKLHGYRAVAFRSDDRLFLRSRNDNDFSARYAPITKALSSLPNNSVVGGEIVALDEDGRPSFNMLQNHGSTHPKLYHYVFDAMLVSCKDVSSEPLD